MINKEQYIYKDGRYIKISSFDAGLDKLNNIVLYPTQTPPTSSTYQQYSKKDGTSFTSWADFIAYVGDDATCANQSFASFDKSIECYGDYIVDRTNTIYTIGDPRDPDPSSEVLFGQIIIVMGWDDQGNMYPARFMQADGQLDTLQIAAASTTQPGMVTTGTQSFAGDKTFTGQLLSTGGFSLSYDGHGIAASDALYLNGYKEVYGDTNFYDDIIIHSGNSIRSTSSYSSTTGKGLIPPDTSAWTANKTIATTDYVSANPGSTSATLSAVTINGTNYKIKGVDLTTTRGSEAISDGTNTINVVTRDTYQTINSVKTFTMSDDTPIKIKYEGNENFAIALQPNYMDDTIIYRLGVEDNSTTNRYYNLYFPAKNDSYLLASSKETIWEQTTTEGTTRTDTKVQNAKLDFEPDRWIITGTKVTTTTNTETGETTTDTKDKTYEFYFQPLRHDSSISENTIPVIESYSWGKKSNIQSASGIYDISRSYSSSWSPKGGSKSTTKTISIWGAQFKFDINGDTYTTALPEGSGTLAVTDNTNGIPDKLDYVTEAPTAANTDGVKIAILSSEPATKYDGWLYFII